jgi:hypothetical protein
MENIYLRPTDKPSRLGYIYETKTLHIFTNGEDPNDFLDNLAEKRHIYITSDEEIKIDDYITDGYVVWQWKDDSSLLGRKKVILSTDQDLIKDGVQAIDDTFLEWFVKNPSCEWVGVVKDRVFRLDEFRQREFYNNYKIIIPKEEPKRKIDTCYNFNIEIGCVQNICRCEQEEPKQETLEEVAENKFGKVNPTLGKSDYRMGYESGLISGARLQAERGYSEEDMITFIDWSKSTNQEKSEYELKCLLAGVVIDSKTLFNMWAKQFKKK